MSIATNNTIEPSTSAIANVVLIAHDNLKPSMVEWAGEHAEQLKYFNLFATGTTGALIENHLGLPIHKFKSGPLGGDQQIGAKIAEGGLDMVIFFWDPLAPHPHDVDVKALIRIAAVYDVPMACNRASANLFMKALLPNG
jgi:methylglyoxal synthase